MVPKFKNRPSGKVFGTFYGGRKVSAQPIPLPAPFIEDRAGLALDLTAIQCLRLCRSLTQKPTWPDYWRQTTAFEPDTGRSALAARTALLAPLRPLNGPARNGAHRWKAAVPDLPGA
jgi:hypothetical protein